MSPPSSLKRKKNGEDEEEEDEDMDISDEEGAVCFEGIVIPPPPRAMVGIDTTGTRLIITKISNYFFKSYANEQVLGPFHKCFNAIIGPNGSGKSNVIDAMLFVFGYRASKLRSKKLPLLLHNSEKYQDVQSCTVSVHFAVIKEKEDDDYEVVPDGRFVISRTANKDGSSFYQINGNKSNFKAVAKMLRNYGVDLDHNRFLILQGEVEQIAMMKCKASNEHESGMLEYLEDIIGTSRFKEPIAKLDNLVEVLADRRSEQLNRVKLIQKELDELQKPMEEAVEFLTLENSITYGKNFIFQRLIYDVNEKIKQTEEEMSEVSEAQKQLEEKLVAITTEKNEKSGTIKDIQKNYEEVCKKHEKMKDAFNNANNMDMRLQADMTQLNTTRKKTKELLIGENKKLEQLQQVPEKNGRTIAECIAKEKQMSAKKETLENDKAKLLASLRAETQELQEKKEVLQTALVDLNKAVDDAKSVLTLAESELKIYVSNEETERNKFESLQSTYKTIKETITQRTSQIAELKKKIPLTEKSLKEVQEDLQSVKIEEAKLIDKIRSSRSNLAHLRSSMQDSKSRGRVLDSLMQQKREGNCPGLFGRLGDLGAIDQKYDIAVSTACGPLDNIVVDTVSTAQWCIEYLKEYNIGRATFIALEKQEHFRNRANTRINTPENVHRLFDLIRIEDERVKTAFYYALRDTLVAKDLDQASRIAYGAQRYRVVTLAGQLIETIGTMSGGGSVSRGRMGQSVKVTNKDPRELERMEIDLKNLEEQTVQLRQQQSKFESQINALEPELTQMKIDFEKFSAELQSAKQQEAPLLKQLRTQESKSKMTKADPAIVKKMMQGVAAYRAKYEKASEIAGKKQEKVDELTAEIKEKTTGKMKTLDKSLKETNNIIDKCKSEITRLQVGIKTSERDVKKTTEKIAQMEQDITDAENKLRAMKAKRETIETDATVLLNTIEKLVKEQSDLEQAVNEMKVEVASMTKEENKIKADKIEVDEKCKSFNKVIREKKGEIQGWKSKISNLKLQKIPNQTHEDLKTYSVEELTAKDIQGTQRELHANEERLKTIKPNLNAIADYQKKQTVFIERSKELDNISNKKAATQEHLDGVRMRRKEEFITGYNIIRLKLKEMYQMITLGGDADFEMVDTFDPFTEGIQFNVRPPKKSWKNISNLSGGEKTLSSLALVFALHYYKPSPLYVMDEIDAALDFKNVSIVGNYIKERTKNAQFIIISLRPNMFELCDYLIGIYKIFNCTRTATIDPRVFEKHAGVPAAPLQNAVPVSEGELNNHQYQIENGKIDESESKRLENIGAVPETEVSNDLVIRGQKRKSSELAVNSDDDDVNQVQENEDENDIVIASSLTEDQMDVD